MGEYCFQEECFYSSRKAELQDSGLVELCQSIAGNIASAGGAGLMEAYPCPWTALRNLAPQEGGPADTAEWRRSVCDKLGILGFVDPDYME